jgi:two-component system phosphate regulon response regulator PhoB
MTAALVIDDEPAILRLVATVLRELGVETLTATDAETATQILKSSTPDLIVSDVRLPGMSGVEFAHQVKANRRLRKTPVLLMSAYSEPSEHEGDAFFPKPFDIAELEEIISRYIHLAGDAGSENGNSGLH